MQQEEKINPLTAIRIAKDMTKKEFAEYFLCSSAYISSVEKNQRKMTLRTLEYGLNKMDISLSGYFELEELRDDLMNKEITHELVYRCMLAKSIGLVNPELKDKADEVIKLTLNSKNKRQFIC